MPNLLQSIIASILLLLFPNTSQPVLNPLNKNIVILPSQTLIIHSSPTSIPSPKPTLIVHPSVVPPRRDVGGPTKPWGVATQISEHQWTMQITNDPTMGTTQDILNALNTYRNTHGSPSLNLDPNLTQYAQTRADYLNSISDVDDHKGFLDYLNNQDGFSKLGFNALGENISYGYRLMGVHLIEWLFAGDKPHNDNQLKKEWGYVGIGTKGVAVAIIFATDKR